MIIFVFPKYDLGMFFATKFLHKYDYNNWPNKQLFINQKNKMLSDLEIHVTFFSVF